MSSPSPSPSLGRIARQVSVAAGATVTVTPTVADASITVVCNTASDNCTANIAAGAFEGQQVLVHIGLNDLDFSALLNFTGDMSPATLRAGSDLVLLVWCAAAAQWIAVDQVPAGADLAMGGHKITGLGSGSDPGDAVSRGQAATALTLADIAQTATSPSGGVISPSFGTSALNINGAVSFTLPDFSNLDLIGVFHLISVATAINTPVGTVTVTNGRGFSTLTFNAVGQTAFLWWDFFTSGWVLVSVNGAVVA